MSALCNYRNDSEIVTCVGGYGGGGENPDKHVLSTT